MKIVISYCGAWNYFPEASRVEAELKASYPNAEITLNKGSGGVFDVKCDGALIYSKHNVEGRRFPEESEITKLITQAINI